MKKLFNRVSVQAKMFFVLAVGLVGFTGYFTVNYIILNDNRESLQKVVSWQMPALETADEIINQLEILLSATPQAVVNQNFEVLGTIDKAHKVVLLQFEQWAAHNYPHANEAQGLFKRYKIDYEKLSDITQNVVAGVSTLTAIQAKYKEAIVAVTNVENDTKSLKQKIDEDLQAAVANANVLSRSAIIAGAIILAIAAMATVLFFFVIKTITRSLTGANGTLQLTSKRLLEMVEEAQISASQLRDTSNRQASSSTETVVSMEQMKRLLSQTSRTSGTAVEISEASFQEANDGKKIVQSLRDAMTVIDRSNTALEEVTQVVRLIRDRTNVINEIVFKTQMLSFNANIEAARAGQHGLGFAVVANEMGNLADMSGKAAQQINELLDKSTEQVETTILSTKEKISNANELSSRCYEFFKLLTERSGELKKMVDSISSAAAEQNSGVEYVVNAMNDLNNTAAETDRMAQGISTLADGLKDQALGLATAVDSLNALVNGRADGSSDGSGPGVSNEPTSPDKPHIDLVRESA